ncbi:MAG: hypothetical protein RIQ83_3094 [Pseudomonadota bacterium]
MYCGYCYGTGIKVPWGPQPCSPSAPCSGTVMTIFTTWPPASASTEDTSPPSATPSIPASIQPPAAKPSRSRRGSQPSPRGATSRSTTATPSTPRCWQGSALATCRTLSWNGISPPAGWCPCCQTMPCPSTASGASTPAVATCPPRWRPGWRFFTNAWLCARGHGDNRSGSRFFHLERSRVGHYQAPVLIEKGSRGACHGIAPLTLGGTP